MDDAGTIVVLEDDPAIADLVDAYLRREGFRVLQASSGEAGVEIINREKPRAAVIDIGLQGSMSGLDVCKSIRLQHTLPILILSARGDEGDRVLGLELGADDYMTKPFSPRELVARIHALLRRSEIAQTTAPEIIRIGDVVIDAVRREVQHDDEQVELAAKEYELLLFFAERPGRALSRQQILDGVWGPGWFGDERTIDVHVRQLRKKLGDDFPLATVRGLGYRLN